MLLRVNFAAAAQQPAPMIQPPAPAAPGAVVSPLTPLGPGDSVTLHVFGQPDMDSVLAVADDGTIRVPLAGSVQVGGVAADEAARRVEKAFKDGGYFVSPHVSLTVTQSLSQRISVLGEVHAPGRYPIDSKTTILDLLAQAGGPTELASNTVYILHTDASGGVKRYPVTLQGLTTSGGVGAGQALHAGDSVFVPRAEQFYILGEVQKPSMYKLEPNLTVIQAISIAGRRHCQGQRPARRNQARRQGWQGSHRQGQSQRSGRAGRRHQSQGEYFLRNPRDVPLLGTDAPLAPATPMLPAQLSQSALSWSQFAALARAHRRNAILISAILIALTLVTVKLLPKSYTAEATVLVKFARPTRARGRRHPELFASYLLTQVDLLQSRGVLMPAIDHLHLTDDAEFTKGFKNDGIGTLKDWVEKQLRANLVVEQGKGTQLLHVAVTSRDRNKAAQSPTPSSSPTSRHSRFTRVIPAVNGRRSTRSS